MSNETKDCNLVKYVEGFSPIEGYMIVVFSTSNMGKKVVNIISPEDKPMKLGLFKNKSAYHAYAVNLEPNLKHKFATQVSMADGIHQFGLRGTFYFNADDYGLLASRVDRDPIRIIKEEILQKAKFFMRSFKWENVIHNFESLVSNNFLQEHLPQLRSFSKDYGVNLVNIELDHVIPKEYIKVNIEVEKAGMQKELNKIAHGLRTNKRGYERDEELSEQVHQENLKNNERGSYIKDEQVKLVARAYQQISEKIETIEDLKHLGAQTNINTFDQAQHQRTITNESNKLLSQQDNKRLLTAQTPGDDTDSLMINDLYASINQLSLDEKDKKELLSKIMHISAELIREGFGDPELIRENFQDFIDLLQVLEQKIKADGNNFLTSIMDLKRNLQEKGILRNE